LGQYALGAGKVKPFAGEGADPQKELEGGQRKG
jgi:hypothetical protein